MTTKTDTEQERAAFEWWASDEGESPRSVERAGECYKLAQIQSYWMAWMARAALQSQDREDALIEVMLEACDEWSQYVEVDTAPRTLREHIQLTIDHARLVEGES